MIYGYEMKTYLISKTNTTTKHEPSKDKHKEVDSSSIKNGANYEENAGNQHGQPSSEASGGVRSTKGVTPHLIIFKTQKQNKHITNHLYQININNY
ncbi:hypothetical protein CsatB_019452 [Cannabis sativa]